MNKPAAIDLPAATLSASLDAETAKLVAALAERRGQSPEQFAAEAIQRVAERESDLDAFVQEGIDAIDRGDVVSQDAMEVWFEERIAARRQA